MKIEAETAKLAGLQMDLLQKIRSGNITLEQLEQFLNAPFQPPELKTFKTIKLGTGFKTADEFREALKKGGNRISDWGDDILGKSDFEKSIAPEEVEVDLCVTTTKELTRKDFATTKEIFDAIKRIGELCPAEVGAQLRLQYTDQPRREWLRVAMEPIKDSGGDLVVFGVVHGRGVRGLSACYGYPGYRWSADRRWVFVRRKS